MIFPTEIKLVIVSNRFPKFIVIILFKQIVGNQQPSVLFVSFWAGLISSVG